MNDWIFKSMGASNHTDIEREFGDYYATSPDAVKKLIECEHFGKILEPACGGGHIAKTLSEAGYEVKAQDLYDHGYGEIGIDFLLTGKAPDMDIITNPPYKYATEFVRHSLDVIDEGRKVAMFLKIQFLESEKRYKLFRSAPPARVYVFVKRQKIASGGKFLESNSNSVCYAWFVWVKGFTGDPVIKWIK